jgi:hypothetical protein
MKPDLLRVQGLSDGQLSVRKHDFIGKASASTLGRDVSSDLGFAYGHDVRVHRHHDFA